MREHEGVKDLPRGRHRERHKTTILLVNRVKIIVLHARHAFQHIFLIYSSQLRREITKFEVSTATRAY